MHIFLPSSHVDHHILVVEEIGARSKELTDYLATGESCTEPSFFTFSPMASAAGFRSTFYADIKMFSRAS